MLFAAALVVATLVVMASGKVPAVLALAAALAIAGVTGITPVSELSAGLSNGGVITVACMLVLARGVVQTGVVTRVTWKLLATAQTAGQAFRRLVAPISVASALINTTPIVAMLVPAAKELQQTKAIPAREVLLPVAHATTLAGSVTLVGTSSNLLIAGIAAPAGVEMGMFDFAPVALPVAIVGAVVLAVTAPRLLRGASPVSEGTLDWRVEIPVAAGANALGRMPASLGLETTQDYRLEAIQRWGEDLDPSEPVEAGDLLVYRASENGVRALWGSPRFGLAPQRLYAVSVGPGEHGTLDDLEEQGDLKVVAAQTSRPLRETPVLPGSTCFVTAGSADALEEHTSLTLWQSVTSRVPQPGKTWIALSILGAVIVCASTGLLPVELAAFAGAVLMVVTRVITPQSAARALDWNVLFVLAGSVGLGAIVVSSGLADVIADGITALSGDSAVLVVVVFAVTTAVLTNVTTNAAAASILTPVALGIAASQGLDPVTLLALIGTCISFTLINPFSHQSNLMVLGPGGYSNREFARFGIPLLIVCLITVSIVGYLLIG
jgi:di/tricarboxylate transporter